MKKKKWFILVITIILVCSLIFAFFKSKEDFIFDSNAHKYESPIKKPKDWENDRIAFPAFKDGNVGKNDKFLKIALSNPDFNDVYFKYFIFIDKESKAFYKTRIIKPGEAVTEIPLPSKLTLGEHTVKVETRAFSVQNPKVSLNSASTFFKLRILDN